MNYLLEAGVHFGHQKRRWNPKMKEYIYTSRDDIYIIDLQKTQKLIEEAYEAIKELAQNEGTFLFVGTKKQANEAMIESATRTNQFYVTERWLGGTLTNFKTIKSRVRRLEEIEAMEQDGTFELLPKKEVIGIKKEYEKLNKYLNGIRNMKKMPSALIIVDPKTEETAIKEARKLNIPVFGIVDTNCDPDMVDYVIPANDDAVRAVKLVIGVLANAIAEVNDLEMINYVTEEDKNGTADTKKERVKKAISEVVEVAKQEVNETVEEVKDKAEEVKEKIINATEEATDKVKEAVADTKEKAKKATPKVEKAVKEIKKTVKKAAKEVKEVFADYDSMTVAELKKVAKENGIAGYSTMKKAEILDALKK